MAAGSTEETFGLLLNVLAQSLDVQEVFVRISALARQTVPHDCLLFGLVTEDGNRAGRDRKSTRLNSSHTVISYAVFCLKKKTRNRRRGPSSRVFGNGTAPLGRTSRAVSAP